MAKFSRQKKANETITSKRGCWINAEGVISYGYGAPNECLLEGEEKTKEEMKKFGKEIS